MKIIPCRKNMLGEFWKKFRDSEQQLRAWRAEAKNAGWRNPHDVKDRYVNASILTGSRVVFDICGNKYRLVVKINYQLQIIHIRFVGTHKEYDRIDAETI